MNAFRDSDFRSGLATGALPAPRVTYHADLAAAQAEPALFALAEAPFDRAAWFAGLADCGLTPFYALAQDDAGGAALFPLHRAPKRLEALANWYTFRWRPLIAATTDAQAHALLTAIARDLPRGRITLEPLPYDDALRIAAAFRAAGWVVDAQPCDTNHILPVRGRGYALYLAGRPGPLRTTLARKGNKVRCTIHTAFTADLWATYEAVYRASWKPEEGHPAFLRAFAQAEAAAGRLRLGLAHTGDEPVAAQFWTVEAGTAFIHKLAHAERAHALSPGTTLTAAMIEYAMETDRVSLIDFGTGDEPYKRDWMETARPRHRLDMFHPADPHQWPHIARATLRQARK